jgi:hypothetical protein
LRDAGEVINASREVSHPRVRAFDHKGTVLRKAKDVWALCPDEVRMNLSLPQWYAGVHGVPNWLLRQPISSKKMDDKRRGLALLVRMNYILDYEFPKLVTREAALFGLHPRRVTNFVRDFGPLYNFEEGRYMVMTPCRRVNTSYALSTDYDWKRALACTTREFVHLLTYCRSWTPRVSSASV